MTYVFDTYAWVEYLQGSKRGEKVRKLLKTKIHTDAITVAEITSKAKRAGKDENIAIEAIHSLSTIEAVSPERAKTASIIHAEIKKGTKDSGLADALIMALAYELDATIVTGDKHFKQYPKVKWV